MNKATIVTELQNVNHLFSETCYGINEKLFFEKPGGKWSVAENIRHLILSTGTTLLAFNLPKVLVRWIGGKSNRASRSFDELLARYNKKLDEGGKASSRYVPKPLSVRSGKSGILDKWNKVTSKLIHALNSKNTEEDLDKYIVTHPLLGRITLRELCYFTIFHTRHHLDSITKMLLVT